jgi:hypothetical protein
MSATRLDTPFLDGALRSTNYFNGRILSREDMQRDRDAERAIDERLGLALGHGVVSGLGVDAKAIGGSSITNPIVTVHPGLAVNRNGQTVALDRDVDVALLQPAPAAGAGGTTASALAGSFNTCAPPDTSVYVTGTGVYLLTIAPATTKQGLALVSGLGNAAASCNAKEVVEGVQFRLFQMTALSGAELADEARLRNVAAYKFFFAALGGSGAPANVARDPFGPTPATAALTDPALTDCDVPLALFNWTATGGLRWVDLWSVRRRLARPALPGEVPIGPDPELAAASEATVMQFQEHIETLRLGATPFTKASDAFRWLPPAGLLPIAGIAGAVGFDSNGFFSGLTTRGPMFIEGARVRPFLRLATTFPPITVADPDLVWLYLVRENRQPLGGVTPMQPYLLFALGRLPCQVVPRFDVSRWNFANYALDDERTGL